jgi:hypothetical protein
MIAVYAFLVSGGFILGVITTCLSLMFGFKESKPVKKQLLKG